MEKNRGFTFLELVTAVAFLAIVATIFYEGFLLAASTTAKARAAHVASTTAQNLMDIAQTLGGEGLLAQFDDPAGGSFTMLPASWVGVMDVSHIYKTTPETGLHEMFVKGMVVDGKMFDARITLDARPFMAAVDENGMPNAHAKSKLAYNSLPMAAMPQLSRGNTAVVNNFAGRDREALNKILPVYKRDTGNAAATVENIDHRLLRRTVTITIEHDAASGHSQVKAEYSYDYDKYLKIYTASEVIYDNQGSDAVLENLSIQFRRGRTRIINNWRPHPYKFDWGRETIIISNPQSYALDCLLLVEIPTSDGEPDAWTAQYPYEIAYRDQFYLYVQNGAGHFVDTPSPLRLRTNLGEMLAEAKNSSAPAPRTPDLGNYHIYYNNRRLTDLAQVEKYLGFRGFFAGEVEEQMYALRVELFRGEDQGGLSFASGQPVAQLEGNLQR